MNMIYDAEKAMEAVIESWREDPGFRAQVDEDPKAALESRGLVLRVDTVRVAVDTPDVRHFVFPPNPNAGLSDERLSAVAGGSGCIDCYIPTSSGSGCF